jgi:hypothetical protein
MSVKIDNVLSHKMNNTCNCFESQEIPGNWQFILKKEIKSPRRWSYLRGRSPKEETAMKMMEVSDSRLHFYDKAWEPWLEG